MFHSKISPAASFRIAPYARTNIRKPNAPHLREEFKSLTKLCSWLTRMFKSVFKTGIRGAYNVSDNASFSTELWSVYPAKHRQNGKLASVFILDKYKLESHVSRLCSQSSNTRNPRAIISEYYEQIKLEISNLTKLKHPQILTVLEVLEETKSKFLFATESVTGNLPTLSLKDETDVGIQKGLLEICKGLEFLHNFCSTIHLNLQPSSVFVNQQGDWKLAGFKFLQNLNEMSAQDKQNYFIMNSSVIEYANHNLNFMAPELVIDDLTERLSTANDVWSLGMMIYYLYNKGEYAINCSDISNVSEYKQEFRKFEHRFYNHRPAELKYLLKDIPTSLYPTMMHLLARFPNDRMSISQFIDSDFFNGSLIKLMWFIDEFTTKSIEEKTVFLDGILGAEDILSLLPKTFRNGKLLPLLIKSIQFEVNLLRNNKILDLDTDLYISKMIQVVFNIGKFLLNLSFLDRICDSIMNNKGAKKSESQLTEIAKTSVKVRLSIVSNFDVMSKKLSQKVLVDFVKDIAQLCLAPPEKMQRDVDTQDDQIVLQDMFLRKLSLVAPGFDFPYMKNSLFPLLCHVFKTTTVLSTKLETIKTFDILIEKKAIDQTIVNDQLLPIFEKLKSRDKRIVKEVLNFFVSLQNGSQIDLDLEVSVDKVLNQCFRLVFGCHDCTKRDFEIFMASIEQIQQSIVSKKLDSLKPESRRNSANFESLIQNSLLRPTPKEATIRTPVLKPNADAKKEQNTKLISKQFTSRHSALRAQRAAQQDILQPRKTSNFGATSADSNRYSQSVVSNPKVRHDNIDNIGVMRPLTSASPPIDWSNENAKKPAVDNSSIPLQKSGVLSAHQTASTNIKLPPGFATDMVLTPNSTGTTLQKRENVMLNKDSENLLDFL